MLDLQLICQHIYHRYAHVVLARDSSARYEHVCHISEGRIEHWPDRCHLPTIAEHCSWRRHLYIELQAIRHKLLDNWPYARRCWYYKGQSRCERWSIAVGGCPCLQFKVAFVDLSGRKDCYDPTTWSRLPYWTPTADIDDFNFNACALLVRPAATARPDRFIPIPASWLYVRSVRTNTFVNLPHRSCYPVKTYGQIVKHSKQAVDRVMNARYSMTYHAWEVFKPLNCNDDLTESSQVLALSVCRYRQRYVIQLIQSDKWGSNGYLSPYCQHKTPATPLSPPHNSPHPPPTIKTQKRKNATKSLVFSRQKRGNPILKKAIQIPLN